MNTEHAQRPVPRPAKPNPLTMRAMSLTLLCAATIALVPQTLAQTISPIVPISGGLNSSANGVNANGTAAAGSTDTINSSDRAIRWSNLGGTVSMGLLPGGTFNTYAQAIDASGTILAGFGDSGSSRAFRWTTTGGYQILPLIPGTGSFNLAWAISQNGAIVVGTSGSSALARAFLWNSASPASVLNLGLLPGQPTSDGRAVSGDGSTVVGNSGTRAFRWTSGSGMTDLGALPGQVWALGEAVNTNGTVATGRYNTGGERGYRWTAATGMVSLGNTPNGGPTVRPRAINGDGTVIIGECFDPVAGFAAFIWTPSLGVQFLSAHLAARGVNLTGWQITDATGISADGSAMCGRGTFDGMEMGWVVRGLSCGTATQGGWGNSSGCVGATAGINANRNPVIGGIYRWTRNGVLLNNGVQPSGSLLAGATTPQLSLANMQVGDHGTYTFFASIQGACESSFSVFFDGVINVANIVVQPTPNTACQGQNPSLFCAASTNNGGVTYRWQKFVGPGPTAYADIFDGPSGNGGSYLGTGTSTFSILNAQPADTTLYRCAISHTQCGPTPQIYSGAVLFTINSLAGPTVTGPGDSYHCAGDSDVFISVAATPAAGNTYRWQRLVGPSVSNYADIFDGPTGNGSFYGQTGTATLGLYAFSAADSNRYRCRVTGPCGGVTISTSGFVGAIQPAAIITHPTSVAQCPGDTDIFFAVTATPGVTYRWQKFVGPRPSSYADIFDGPTGNGSFYGQTGTAIMGIYGITAADYGLYRCRVTDVCFLISANSLAATFAAPGPPNVTTQPVGGPVSIGSNAVLSVVATGVTTYQWWRYVPAFPIYAPVGNGTLPSGAIVTGATGPTLTISNFQSQDAGQYYCSLIGDCSINFSAVVTLTVGGACTLADVASDSLDTTYNPNGSVGPEDLDAFIAAFIADNASVADVASDSLDTTYNPNGSVGPEDLDAFIASFIAGC